VPPAPTNTHAVSSRLDGDGKMAYGKPSIIGAINGMIAAWWQSLPRRFRQGGGPIIIGIVPASCRGLR